ncbi:MAG TPA: elongation factor G [Bacteroidales bacterium]|nr:elongation factor G [Bacteroidales bacterium]HPR57735.1 elongation factor G [Bacteroidales bacterium]HRW96775.1 elongation factor G [Bacteroidales bacterium]
MKVYQTDEIRNIALVGGAKSGKTTLSECMLFEGGVINRRGSVDDQNTVSDYRDIEHERQNSVSSTVMYAEFEGKKINIIDTPGFDDFVGEVISALKVVDTAVMVINAQNGVEVGAEISWRYTSRNHTPVVFVVNHLEHEKSNFEETVRQLKTQFGNQVTICQYPVNAGLGFDSVVDLIKMKMYKYPENGGEPQVLDIPASEKDKADELHAELIESAAAGEDALMETFFESGTLTEEEMLKGIKAGLITRSIFPVFCINAKHNMGVRRLMSFITNSVPAPNEMQPAKTTTGKELRCNTSDPLSLFVFKTSIESHLGEVSFFKVMNGVLNEATDLVNATNSSKERLSQLFLFAGKNREKIAQINAGDFGATIKLKNTSTNETLNTPRNADDIVEPIVFPEPKIQMAVKAQNQSDDEKLSAILNDMHKVDKTFHINYSKELRQLIAGGMGELHLNLIKWMVENIHKIPMEYFTMKIPYRETITKSAKAVYRHKKQSGGAGQFGEVHMMIEPYSEGMSWTTEFPVRGTDEVKLDWGGKLIMNNCIVGGAIDARFMPAIMKGLMEKMENGPLTGSYARDIVVYVYDGKMHPVDSNEISFKLASRNAFKEAFKNAGPKILEPIYDVEVIVPEEKMGDVMTDLQGRRAVIMGMDSEGNYQKIIARVPLAEMNRYSTALSSITSGRAMYSLKFAEYAQVPGDVQTELLKAHEAEQAEED